MQPSRLVLRHQMRQHIDGGAMRLKFFDSHALKSRSLLIVLYCLLLLMLVGSLVLFGTSAYVVGATSHKVAAVQEIATFEDVDCILVLGCLVRSDGSPSDMLADRLKIGVQVYEGMCAEGHDTVLLMSGDHGRKEYNEVYAMKQFAIEAGVESSKIFMDHAGFSTYESIYRAKEIFGADRIVIVTQGYHLSRALYIAQSMGIDAVGVSADLRSYRGQINRDVREILARNKDFWLSVFHPEPTYLGEPISLEGSGDVTNDYE